MSSEANRQLAQKRIFELQVQVVMSTIDERKCWKLLVRPPRAEEGRQCNSLMIQLDPARILKFFAERAASAESKRLDECIARGLPQLLRTSKEFSLRFELPTRADGPVQGRARGADLIRHTLLRLVNRIAVEIPVVRVRELTTASFPTDMMCLPSGREDQVADVEGADASIESRLQEIVIREEDFAGERELSNNNTEEQNFHYSNARRMRRNEFLGEADLNFYLLYKLI
ncbi:hypothetical protein TSAR_005172 [Trichomalopsis sarcophagae]|uniref:Uncharacterized protein n=1 Tax=Trichomalopsis sarcophagae TaxID=543379 RepID=A0A232EF00_9HYME|nr:hypothetical protein TSAR_005172 [Trichomalopsis sarcophagae]